MIFLRYFDLDRPHLSQLETPYTKKEILYPKYFISDTKTIVKTYYAYLHKNNVHIQHTMQSTSMLLKL